MPGGRLPRRDSELVILRVAHNCGSRLRAAPSTSGSARRAGLGATRSTRVRGRARRGRLDAAPGAAAARRRRAARRRATICRRALGGAGAPSSTSAELIELCLLVGHYEMLAMTLNALRVAPDRVSSRPPTRAARALQALAERRR